ncbi:pyrroloquinoline quinone biosynthesis peptide chaperone PqqD [Methylolobus aquaticus]|jgi:pyrroloquinoline quinone biosynthesis protein D|uniref:pyrroloquinoline quinone biosynthesis peptide chaperone PqqD n=1 Tax=Methylotetracoccus oryzae TaxID=1919059 RepID=UPI00101EF22B|nr:pyrroloquinoline quinone biosynthesis peptide chaperone PqqD [Methylotetracoccus oryzae]RYU57780.1 pyrroloquinoline quinone biosynthesis peptide chaperone PqqD [Methylolobus aquaticus]
MALDPNSVFQFSPTHRLQWEETQQKHVILYPEGLVELSDSAAEILKLCDGTRDLSEMVTALENKFETTDLMDDVAEFLEAALHNGWIRERSHH